MNTYMKQGILAQNSCLLDYRQVLTVFEDLRPLEVSLFWSKGCLKPKMKFPLTDLLATDRNHPCIFLFGKVEVDPQGSTMVLYFTVTFFVCV